MKYIFFLLVFTSFSIFAFSKGGSGEYYISGIAFDNKNQPIKNGTIAINFNEKRTIIKTDNLGKYKIIVAWQTACPSDFYWLGIERENERLNPKWIFVTYEGTQIKIANQWRKYSDLFSDNENHITRVLNIIFTKSNYY